MVLNKQAETIVCGTFCQHFIRGNKSFAFVYPTILLTQNDPPLTDEADKTQNKKIQHKNTELHQFRYDLRDRCIKTPHFLPTYPVYQCGKGKHSSYKCQY